MRNRAKCKLCEDILESFHKHDYVTCKCGEISIDGGDYYMHCSARDWHNFLRVDDNDNEIVPEIIEKDGEHHFRDDMQKNETEKVMNKKELIYAFKMQTEHLETLPRHERYKAVSNADLHSFMLLLLQILEAD